MSYLTTFVNALGLECPLCVEFLTEPKQLSCAHTFCEECLDKLYRFQGGSQNISCPICHKITPLLDGDVSSLQSNVSIKTLADDAKSTKKTCTVCTSDTVMPAQSYCVQCDEFMCGSCVDIHGRFKRNAKHRVESLDDIKAGRINLGQFCQNHPEEEKQWVCFSCKVATCCKCRESEHRGPNHDAERLSERIRNLQEIAKGRVESIMKHIELVNDEREKVDEALDTIEGSIIKVYEEAVQQLTKSRDELIEQCKQRRDTMKNELQEMLQRDKVLASRLGSASDLIKNGLRALDGFHLQVQGHLRGELQNMLRENETVDRRDRDPSRISKEAQITEFIKAQRFDRISLGEILVNDWTLKKANTNNISFAGKGVNGVVPTRDGRVAVGYFNKGVEMFILDGSRKWVLKDVKVVGMSGLSDGRYVVRDQENKLTIYTPEWERVKVMFNTLNLPAGGWGAVSVDAMDNIYIAYIIAGKIAIFKPEGGNPIREIPFLDYEPRDLCPLSLSSQLVTSDGSTVRVVDAGGTVKHQANKTGACAYHTVLSNDGILIAWLKDDMLVIDLYTPTLGFLKEVYSDRFEETGACWLRALPEGNVAFCTQTHLKVLEKDDPQRHLYETCS